MENDVKEFLSELKSPAFTNLIWDVINHKSGGLFDDPLAELDKQIHAINQSIKTGDDKYILDILSEKELGDLIESALYINAKYKMDGFLKCLATYLFVIDLKVLLDNNISLQKSLDIIRHNKNNMLACLLAYQLHNSLIEWNQFEDSLDNQFFDSQFHAICLYGLRNDDFISSLKDYEDIMELKMNRSLKRIGALVQIICYGFVSIIIILAYQVLMIPLTIIEGI